MPPRLHDIVNLKGSLLVQARQAFSKQLIWEERHTNTLFSVWLNALVSDLVKGASTAQPKCLALSREVIAGTPANLQGATTGEFRMGIKTYNSNSVMQLIGILAPSEGNGIGNIKSCGLVYGSSATLVAATGNLGSLINTLNVTKDSSVELTFQYEISFS